MTSSYKFFILSLFISFSFISCQEDEEVGFENYKDKKLRNLLKGKSPTGALDFFILPQSDDFSNIPQDPLNPLSAEKIELGKFLFHETGIGTVSKLAEGLTTYSCASCHQAGAGFQAGLAQGIGEGGIGFGLGGEGRILNPDYPGDSIDVQPIRTPTILNSAFQINMLWNGQFGATGLNVGTESNWTAGTPKAVNQLGYEGVETQAIAGMGVHRLNVDAQILQDLGYKEMFDRVYSEIPETERYTTETAGLAIAAFERTVMSNDAPFQQWLRGEYLLPNNQLDGAFLFFEKGGCDNCHTGPALNDMSFHAIGMLDLDSQLGTYGTNASNTENKGRGGFTGNVDEDYTFKVPQLYNLAGIEFLGHGSSFHSVKDVVEYKNAGISENPRVNSSQLSPNFTPLNLSSEEIDLITLFIEESLYDPNIRRFVPDNLPSNNCFPNADDQSKVDLGCN